MATTWIVAADESRAKILQVTGRKQNLTEQSARVFAREVGRYLLRER
jgi:hypothetical protein